MTLSDLYEKLEKQDGALQELAAKAGTSRVYLYQLAKRIDNRRPSIKFMKRLAAADKRLKLEHMVAEFADDKESA